MQQSKTAFFHLCLQAGKGKLKASTYRSVSRRLWAMTERFSFSPSCGVYLYFPHQIQIELLFLFAFTPPPPPRVRRTEAIVSSADAVCSSCGTTNTTSIFLCFLRLSPPPFASSSVHIACFSSPPPVFSSLSLCVCPCMCVRGRAQRRKRESLGRLKEEKPSTARCSKKRRRNGIHILV